MCVMGKAGIDDVSPRCGTGCADGRVMRRLAYTTAVLIMMSMCTRPVAYAGDDGYLEAMMFIAGVTDEEELGENMIEECASLRASPLRINMVSQARLAESGLLSQYQIASLMDYRSRSGDVLSLEELAAIDGFGKEYATALSFFISFESDALPGRPAGGKSGVSSSLTVKTATKKPSEDEFEYNYGFKYRLDVNDRLEISFTGRNPYSPDIRPPEVLSFNVTCYGRRRLGKVIAGDFNARFGQGLALWSGFSMGGVSAPESYSKRPSGISPYRSYSGDGSLRGLAADFTAGRFVLTAFIAADGLRGFETGKRPESLSMLPAINIGYFGKDFQTSLTCYAQTGEIRLHHGDDDIHMKVPEDGLTDLKVSADIRYNIRGTELFSETAADIVNRTAAALVGSRFRIGEMVRMAVMGRYYPAGYSSTRSGALRSGTKCANEYAVSASGTFSAGEYVTLAGREGFGASVIRHKGVFGTDVSYAPEPRFGTDRPTRQVKILFDYDCQVSPAAALSLRVAERVRDWGNTWRTDVRLDFRYDVGKFMLAVRVNALRCKGTGLLSYMEGGYRNRLLTLYVRGGLFRIDNWDDRIYVYERDAPGNFNVPSYYGRGYWTAMTAGVKCARWLRIYLRMSYLDYPWKSPCASSEKPGKAEMKLQAVFRL